MGANKDVDFARFDGLIKVGEAGILFVITIKTGNFGIRKEAAKFGFKQFSAKTFVYNVGMVTIWTR